MIIKPELEELQYVKEVAIAGPGFINISLITERWHKILEEIINKKTAFGDCNIGNNEKINY